MGFLSKLFGRSGETDDQKEIRLYNEEKSAPHRVTETPFTEAAPACPNGAKACFVIDDVFTITGRGIVVKGTVAGTVVTGTVTKGSFSVGDKITANGITTVITGIEQFRKQCDTICEGDNAGILLKDVSRGQIGKGDLIIK